MSQQLRGVILAGGTGSRLYPLTKVTNKHLLPVGREPMIFHSVRQLVGAGIREIMIVTGTEHVGDVIGLLGSGCDFDCAFTYRVQDEAGGIAQALGLAEAFSRGGRLMVLLGDNIFGQPLRPFAETFTRQLDDTAKILLKPVPSDVAGRFGVAVVHDGAVERIVEKPSAFISHCAVTGCYFYDDGVFDIIRTLKPSGRGELEITDVNNVYARKGRLAYEILTAPWTDAGTFESLAQASELLIQTR